MSLASSSTASEAGHEGRPLTYGILRRCIASAQTEVLDAMSLHGSDVFPVAGVHDEGTMIPYSACCEHANEQYGVALLGLPQRTKQRKLGAVILAPQDAASSACVSAAVDFVVARWDVRRLEVEAYGTDPFNRVLEDAGFEAEARFEEALYRAGARDSLVIYARLTQP